MFPHCENITCLTCTSEPIAKQIGIYPQPFRVNHRRCSSHHLLPKARWPIPYGALLLISRMLKWFKGGGFKPCQPPTWIRIRMHGKAEPLCADPPLALQINTHSDLFQNARARFPKAHEPKWAGLSASPPEHKIGYMSKLAAAACS